MGTITYSQEVTTVANEILNEVPSLTFEEAFRIAQRLETYDYFKGSLQ